MQIKTISIQEYRNYLDTLDVVIFQQSDFQAQKFMHDGGKLNLFKLVSKVMYMQRVCLHIFL